MHKGIMGRFTSPSKKGLKFWPTLQNETVFIAAKLVDRLRSSPIAYDLTPTPPYVYRAFTQNRVLHLSYIPTVWVPYLSHQNFFWYVKVVLGPTVK